MEQHEIEKVALIKKLEEEQTEVALMEQNEVALIKKLAEEKWTSALIKQMDILNKTIHKLQE